MAHKQIYYSDKYDDDKYEYRHVMLPKEIAKRVPKTHLMSETEWRNLGVQQSQGWVHYMIHQPGPGLDPDTGRAERPFPKLSPLVVVYPPVAACFSNTVTLPVTVPACAWNVASIGVTSD
ncbi:Cyclin-dependent kinases regulatory subunit 1 [Takifugu flavidus]|uniref:Cyclin-dependent kinases regulatory subunit n=1 Tax=Takifugu flavidus TaxID=433684 RepID=A0A5C6NG52_9TELE|nr:Cyclin-dependent kinases regulatory subunit 1 [Takifugu flavidus]